MSKERPIYLQKRWITLFIIVVAVVFVALNFHAVKHFIKGAPGELFDYSKKIGPFYVGLILGAMGFGDSSFLSLPEGNDFLIVYFSIIHSAWMPWFVFTSAIGSLAGSLILFSMGKKGEEVLFKKRFSPQRVQKIQHWFQKYDIWAILVPCLIPPPMPFKIFVLSAGIMRIKYHRFVIATLGGRLIRYAIWGVLAIIFKNQIKYFMKHYLMEIGIGIVVLLTIVGFLSWFFSHISQNEESL